MGLFSGLFKKNTSGAVSHGKIESDNIVGRFTSHFIDIISLICDPQTIDSGAKTELFAAMMAITEYVSAYNNIHIRDDRAEIVKWFLAPFESLDKSDFGRIEKETEARLEFYRSREREGRIRGEFLNRYIPEDEVQWPPYRYGLIFCDCIYNPECRKNYDKAPVQFNGKYDKSYYDVPFAKILQKLYEFEQDLKKFAV